MCIRDSRYPAQAKENKIEGRVYIQFIVEKDGNLSKAKIVRDLSAGCGAEALRIVEQMNKLSERWTPGKHYGEIVRVQYTLPVIFMLKPEDTGFVEFIDPDDFTKTISLKLDERLQVFNDHTTIELDRNHYKLVADFGTYQITNYYKISPGLIPPPPPPGDFEQLKTASKRNAFYVDGVKVDRSTVKELSSTEIRSVTSYSSDAAKTLFNQEFKVGRIEIVTLKEAPLGYDTIIVYDPETYTETMTIVPIQVLSLIHI